MEAIAKITQKEVIGSSQIPILGGEREIEKHRDGSNNVLTTTPTFQTSQNARYEYSDTTITKIQEEITALKAEVSALRNMLLARKYANSGVIEKEKHLTSILKEKRKIDVSFIIDNFGFSQNVSARRLMSQFATMHPELCVFEKGDRRRPTILRYIGFDGPAEKARAIAKDFRIKGMSITWKEVKRRYGIMTEQEGQDICRYLPNTIKLKKWKDDWRLERVI